MMLYATSGLIMLRNIFRVVEYAMGQEAYLLSNEWCVYIFDGCAHVSGRRLVRRRISEPTLSQGPSGLGDGAYGLYRAAEGA